MKQSFFGNMQYLLYYFFFHCADALFMPYIGLFMQQHGISSAQLGVINSVLYLVTIIAAFVLGMASDKTRRPKVVILLCLLMAALAALYMRSSVVMLDFMLASMLYGFFTAPGSDIVDKMLLDKLQGNGRMYGMFRLGAPAGYSAGVLMAGALIVRVGNRALFVACALAFCLSAGMVLFMPRGDSAVPAGEKQRVPFGAFIKNRWTPYIYGVLFLWGFSEAGALTYKAIYLSDIGYGADYTSWLISAAMIGQTVAYLLMPLVIVRLCRAGMVACGFLLLSLRILSLAYVQALPFAGMMALQFLGGTGQAFTLCSITQHIGEAYPEVIGNTAQSLKSVFNRGLGSSLGVLLYGFLYAKLQPKGVMLFYAGMTAAFAALTCIFYGVLKRRAKAVDADA